MYDNTSRTNPIRSSTNENVGPATYVICSSRSRKQNCAPFLSTQEKTPTFIKKCNTDAIYDVRRCDKIIGGSSFRNRTPRFPRKDDGTLGPALYTAKPIQWVKKKLKLDPTKPKLYACAVPYSLTVTAPSVPTKVDENGYETDDDGNLIKVPPDPTEPVEVDIKSQFPGTRGWRWSCRSSERFDENRYKTQGPGPAGYSSQMPKCRRAEEDERFREMARLFSFVPRYVEAQEMKAAKERLPGPGDYNIDIAAFPDRCKSINPKPFISSTARFSRFVSDTPAPSKYKICDCITKQQKFSTKCAPFGFDSPRFKRKKIERAPGPASYEIKGALQEKIEKKRNRFALCVPSFNSTARRKLTFVAPDAPLMPSSADYPHEQKSELTLPPVSSSVFKNRVRRFCNPADKRDFVGPAKYNIACSFLRSRERKSFNLGHVAFNFSGTRSTTPAVHVGVPCPTSYNKELSLCTPGFHFARNPRFKCEEETPGPGSYNLHPRVENSTYKSCDTYNLRLKENVLRKKIRLAPRDTRKRWCTALKNKKLLKWFDVELDYEERMILLIQKLFDKPI